MGKTRKASAEAQKQLTVASNSNSEAILITAFGEMLDQSGENISKEREIPAETYKMVLQKLKNEQKQREKAMENLKKQKVEIKKPISKLGNLKLYEEKLDEVPENLMAIYQNQLYDLAKTEVSIEKFACELTFYDFFMRIVRGEPVNIHMIPYKNLQNLIQTCKAFVSFEETSDENSDNPKPMRKSRVFKQLLSQEQTPNSRNYEQTLIQNLTFKMMLEEMELLDGVYLAELRENLDSMDYLADQYREFIVENGLSVKEQKIELKKYQKARQKLSDRNWHIRYNLRKKYGYLC